MASYNNVHDMLVMVALLMVSTGAWVALKYAVRALKEGKLKESGVSKMVEEVVVKECAKRRRRQRVRKDKEEKGGLAAVTAVAALAVMADSSAESMLYKTGEVNAMEGFTYRVQPIQPIEVVDIDMDSDVDVTDESDEFSLFGSGPAADLAAVKTWNPLTATPAFTLPSDSATSAASDSDDTTSSMDDDIISLAPPSLLSDDECDEEGTDDSEVRSILSGTGFSSSLPTSRSTTPSSEHDVVPFEKELDFFRTKNQIVFDLQMLRSPVGY
eukprot:TRINITY_DN795_c0_g2_i1.p1 TRINITY_DN795_c0_g2~~TRINITY_DN795_c0_g2_i1.p1  ORF type:complete len:305 (+),score=62.32 TRINITY_DN795_c0_g2_i1:108-917(+)